VNNNRQNQIRELLEKVKIGTQEIYNSDKYRNFLSTMSKFHKYSFRNNMLIMMQKPEATYVAGYSSWNKNFKRQVQKGEKGIQIIGFSTNNIEVEEFKKDHNGKIVYDKNGDPEKIKNIYKEPLFMPVYVYDITQTKGEPLPKLAHELIGNIEKYNDIILALRKVSPHKIEFESIEGETKGYCDNVNKKIVIKEGMSQAQTIKTIIHEITHADLHTPELKLTMENEGIDMQTKEVEAESTAFVVCEHLGIDTSDYSFGYIASWSGSKDLPELQSSLERIQKQSDDLIERVDKSVLEQMNIRDHGINDDQNLGKQSMEDRINSAKKKSEQKNAALGSEEKIENKERFKDAAIDR